MTTYGESSSAEREWACKLGYVARYKTALDVLTPCETAREHEEEGRRKEEIQLGYGIILWRNAKQRSAPATTTPKLPTHLHRQRLFGPAI